jgi:hypothetical protein
VSEVSGPPGTQRLLVISGFGAARLLETEVGLHILDYELPGDSGRAVARVTVGSTPANLPESLTEQYAVLSRDIVEGRGPAAVVRRYRDDSSPLIRDLRHGWRTGRVDLVFNGDFDLIRDALTE